MKNIFTLFLFSFLIVNVSISQDVALCGWNSNSNGSGINFDAVAFVALVDVPASQNIFFTDMPYNPATNSFTDSGTTGDGIMQITWTGTWTKGTVIRAVETGITTDMFTVTASANGPASPGITVTDAGFSLSGNEGIVVFSSSNAASPLTSVVEIYAYFSANTSDPNPNSDTDCPCSNDFVEIDFSDTNVNSANYTPGIRGNATGLANYNTQANWSTSTATLVLDLTEFTNLTFGGSGLPVELTSFTAKPNEKGTLLNWQTASEENNDYFQVEHSMDGYNFSPLDKITGMGTSASINNYSYQDAAATAGLNYYRLKQVDFDGAFEYSKTISVAFKTNQNSIAVYPNPTSGLLHLNEPFVGTLQVKNILGQLLIQKTIDSDQLTLDVSELSNGQYYLELISKFNEVQNTIFVLQKD